MLPENVNRLVESALDQVLLEASRRAATDSKKVIYDFANRGLLVSSAAASALLEAHILILKEMTAHAWDEMRRVLNEVRIVPYPEIESDLAALLDAKLVAMQKLLSRSIEVKDKNRHTNAVLPIFEQSFKSVESKFRNEVGIYCTALGAKAAEAKANRMSSNITYNLNGDNPRVVINSQDYSINIANSRLVFEEIRKSISSEIQDEQLKDDLRRMVSELEANVGKGGFLKAYSDFVAVAANHMTVIGPFLPALTQLLQVRGVPQ